MTTPEVPVEPTLAGTDQPLSGTDQPLSGRFCHAENKGTGQMCLMRAVSWRLVQGIAGASPVCADHSIRPSHTAPFVDMDSPIVPVVRTVSEPAPIGSRAWVAEIMESTFESCRALRGAGQAEYARRAENAFANFDRVAERLGPPHTPETVLLTYYEKHIDGIHAHVAGHTSQREPVEGRIHDAIVYLVLLKGLIARRGTK